MFSCIQIEDVLDSLAKISYMNLFHSFSFLFSKKKKKLEEKKK
jgi:hypothetical protein